ncbi:hypothetical protein FISHEDRAFT_62859 [Fistulina hepatica ATCC 64428]|uniref:Uncharacterized protein n=1 Tax=Fistulina hepatica ATCC 64428 TaxID=1128425 RepID=A0A0D6ZZF1_9AGAR|nr:hypothetical protein FISHEDRAFT_62859 [Fistulina hepatica ATCC 64428]
MCLLPTQFHPNRTRIFDNPSSYLFLNSADERLTATAFLFNGSSGQWYIWFTLACHFSQIMMVFSWYPDPATSLQNAARFNLVIKRTMWFDVIAAVTLQEPPMFIDVSRQVFWPTYNWIVGEDVMGVVLRELDMMNVMGCVNHVCWALAEASMLSYQASEGLTASLSAEGATGLAHQLSADIFRAATLLYLHAILEHDQLVNPEIKHDVNEVMAAFARAQEHTDMLEKVTIVKLLQYNHRGRVGNRWMIEHTHEDLWKDCNCNGPSVNWCKVLHDSQLLLV